MLAKLTGSAVVGIVIVSPNAVTAAKPSPVSFIPAKGSSELNARSLGFVQAVARVELDSTNKIVFRTSSEILSLVILELINGNIVSLPPTAMNTVSEFEG